MANLKVVNFYVVILCVGCCASTVYQTKGWSPFPVEPPAISTTFAYITFLSTSNIFLKRSYIPNANALSEGRKRRKRRRKIITTERRRSQVGGNGDGYDVWGKGRRRRRSLWDRVCGAKAWLEDAKESAGSREE